ncbi:retinal pigment epithelial membrane protein-domain-containing protein [Blyttiomyces helicus]|uniref:Retinal pigment epithelial membrane protein-domain-containing protein n=1 Tax=Blyttiomyces helicus TaxID=388810 RepID=A0A4P9WK60_9FUNG|nr:retinal pigment epithelial membrane protein-domain-containing protein [Blyttiomyces helicus]|eukprot:RKO93359.1 retinal pigment epithelial membrane protein-domain-containing protein [Blyttiomyces helicus]
MSSPLVSSGSTPEPALGFPNLSPLPPIKIEERNIERLETTKGRELEELSESVAGGPTPPHIRDNVSHSSSFYDSSVPYVEGFCNGTETTDPIKLSTSFSSDYNLDWLQGALYRNGPGILDIEYADKRNKIRTFTFDSWGDGLGLVHRFEIDGDLGKGDIDPTAYSTITPDFPVGRAKGRDHLVLSNDTSQLQELDPVTLTPKKTLKYGEINPLFRGDMVAGVACRDDAAGEMINFCMSTSVGGGAHYRFFSLLDEDFFDPAGHVIATIDANVSNSHSFALTKRFIILITYPYTVSTLASMFSRDVRSSMSFDHRQPTMFHVLDRQRRELVCVYKAQSCFALHVVNSFEEEDGSVCIDLNCYEDDEILRCFSLKNLRTSGMPPLPPAIVRRYVLLKIPEAAAIYKIQKTTLPDANYTHRSDHTLEYPRINPRFKGIPYRFAWGISVSADSRDKENVIWDSIVKADCIAKKKVEWKEDGCYPGEPIMIPSPASTRSESSGTLASVATSVADAEKEDEGMVLSVVLDSKRNNSFLLFLDAASMKEVGRAEVPAAIPFGFHGGYFFTPLP